MLLSFFTKDKNLNISEKKNLLNHVLKLKIIEILIIFFFFVPVVLNFFYVCLYIGSNNILKVFSILTDIFYLQTSKDFDIFLSVFQIIFFISCFLCIVIRFLLSLKIHKIFLKLGTINPNFYQQFCKNIKLSIIFPFLSFKMHEELSEAIDFVFLPSTKI